MNIKKLALAAFAATGLAAAAPAYATTTTFDVMAKDNSLKPVETGLATGIWLGAGDAFQVSASTLDTWVLGSGAERIINADGSTFFGNYNDPLSGQSFLFGSLVGRIGNGDYFLIGSDFDGVANAAGQLFLLVWDSNRGDNSGSIAAMVTADPVPVPPALALMGVGVASLVGMRKKKRTA